MNNISTSIEHLESSAATFVNTATDARLAIAIVRTDPQHLTISQQIWYVQGVLELGPSKSSMSQVLGAWSMSVLILKQLPAPLRQARNTIYAVACLPSRPAPNAAQIAVEACGDNITADGFASDEWPHGIADDSMLIPSGAYPRHDVQVVAGEAQ